MNDKSNPVESGAVPSVPSSEIQRRAWSTPKLIDAHQLRNTEHGTTNSSDGASGSSFS